MAVGCGRRWTDFSVSLSHEESAMPRPTSDGDPVHSTEGEGLLGRLADGDRAALATIYERHGAAAFAQAERLCGAQAAAVVVDAACLGLWRQARAGHADGGGGVGERLLRLARQHALDRLHDAGQRRPCAGDATPPLPPSLIELGDDEARGALEAAPPTERHCLELAYLEGLSVAEIATRTRRPTGAVTDDLRRGLECVRPHLVAGVADVPGLRVVLGVQSGVVVVSVCGELDLAAAPRIADTLRFVAYAPRPVLVDLCDTTLLDSAGLTAVTAASAEITRSGRRFAVACAERGPVARVLALIESHALRAWPDRATALGALRS